MIQNNKQLFLYRLKKAGTALAGGLLFGAATLAFCLMAVSHEFTKTFMAWGLVAGIVWWIASSIYRNIQVRKADEARKTFEETERMRRRNSRPVSASVAHHRTPVLFDYDKQG